MRKLIKINEDHYVIVDDSDIKEGDYYVRTDTNLMFSTLKGSNSHIIEKYCKKITHSTQPIEQYDHPAGGSDIGCNKIKSLSLQEVKELIGEVDVEKKADKMFPNPYFVMEGLDITPAYKEGYVVGYNQCLEDNKEKKYTKNEVHTLMCKAFIQGWKKADVVEAGLEGLETDVECAWILTKHDSTPEKTEWEVKIVDGKLELK